MIAATLRAAGLTSDQSSTEEGTMAQLRTASETAVGQMQALQVGHEIAAQQVEQAQKLRGLVAEQITMLATWISPSRRKRTWRRRGGKNSSIRPRRQRGHREKTGSVDTPGSQASPNDVDVETGRKPAARTSLQGGNRSLGSS
jgi:hypothetical protein